MHSLRMCDQTQVRVKLLVRIDTMPCLWLDFKYVAAAVFVNWLIRSITKAEKNVFDSFEIDKDQFWGEKERQKKRVVRIFRRSHHMSNINQRLGIRFLNLLVNFQPIICSFVQIHKQSMWRNYSDYLAAGWTFRWINTLWQQNHCVAALFKIGTKF